MFLRTQLSPQILLSYATSERLRILEFNVPNVAAQSQIDNLSVPSSPAPGSLRKTAKHVTFCDPLIDLDQPGNSPHTQGLSSLKKTAACKVSFQESSSTINDTKCKSTSNPTSQPIPSLKQHILYTPNLKTKSALKVMSTKATSPCTTTVVQDIIALRWAFLASFGTIRNMPLSIGSRQSTLSMKWLRRGWSHLYTNLLYGYHP